MTQEEREAGKAKMRWKDPLVGLCQAAAMVFACAAALGYVPMTQGVVLWLQIVFWVALVFAVVFAVLLTLMVVLWALGAVVWVLLKLIESPKKRRYWEAREAGEKRFREVFGPKPGQPKP